MATRLIQALVILLAGMLLTWICWPLYDSLGTSLVMSTGVQEGYVTGDDDESLQIYTDNSGFQTFTTESAFTLTEVRLKLFRVGSPGTVVCSIQTMSGALPSGTALTSSAVSGSSLTTDSAGVWVTFDCTDYDVSASTIYAVVVDAAGDTSNYVIWLLDSTSPTYTGGAYGTV